MVERESEHVRGIAASLILTLVTCGVYNLYWQYRQMLATNEMLNDERYRFLPWLAFTLLTCGIYHIYHEYRMSVDIAQVLGRDSKNDGLIAVLLSVFGLSFVVDAIQQSQINQHYGDDDL
jgi:TRAP-type mannitol/chloroaromatic compound transport system permease small subunit